MKDDKNPKKQAVSEETPQEIRHEEDPRIFNTTQERRKLDDQKDKIPNDIFRKATSILAMGTLTEKRLVKKLLDGQITAQRFRLLYKLLYDPEGSDLREKNLKTALTERYINDPEIDSETFELGISAINRAEPKTDKYYGDLELVEDLLNEKNGAVLFRKKLKKEKELERKKIETQEKEKELERDEITSDEVMEKYGDQYRRTVGRAEQVMTLATPANVKETIEFRQLHESLEKARKASIDDYSRLEDIFKVMAKSDQKAVREIEDAVYGLFPETIRPNEKPIEKNDVRDQLLKAEGRLKVKLNVDSHIDEIHKRLSSFQKLRIQIAEYEVKIAEIFRQASNRVHKKIIQETSIENAGDWAGFELKAGQKITYQKDGKEEETEIVNVELSKPVILDERGQEIGERGTGTVLVTISGIGTFQEGEFRKWVDRVDACPKVASVAELEGITGMSEIGEHFEKGTELAYDKVKGRDTNGDVVTEEETVTVENINDTEVTLDKEIVTLHAEEDKRSVIRGELTDDKKAKVLTLGQLAKWMRRNEVVKNPKNVGELRHMTDELEKKRNAKYTTRNPNHFKPPQWKEGKTLFSDTLDAGTTLRCAPVYKVSEINDEKNEIVLSNEHMTRAAALRTARKQELQELDPHVEAERETAFLGDDEDSAEEKGRLKKRIMSDFEKEGKEEKEEEGITKTIPTAGKIGFWAEGIPGASESHEEHHDLAKPPTSSYFEELWKQTNFLSLQDIWEFGKAAYEYHVRRWQRNVKNNFANIGRHFPYIGTEMNRVKQAAENEEAGQFKEAMEQMGIWQIEEILHHSSNRDQVKACLMVLADKGHIKWEEIDLWKTLNRLVDSRHFIPIPLHHDPTTPDKYGKTGQDYIQQAIDSLWGEGQYNEWFNHNNTTYEQHKKETHHLGDQLEGDPKNIGGVTAELGKLLTLHKEGKYVDPHQYEGLIDFIIHKGKSTAEAKLYYLIEGCAARNARGHTILPFDRIGNLDGEYLNRLPFLDYLTDKGTQKPFQDKARPWKREDLAKLCTFWDGGIGVSPTSVKKNGTPPHSVRDFMWDEVLRNPFVLQRNNKGLRNAEMIDHDDAHVIIPLASETLVQNVCGGPSGMKKYFTEEGITNAYCGYNRYIKGLATYNDVPKLLNAIRSFARFDSILGDRYLRDEGDRYTRISKANYFRPAVIDDLYVVDHQRQLHGVLQNIAKAYGWDISLMFEKTKVTSTKEKSPEAQRQTEIERFIKNFGTELEKRARTDGGKKLVQAVNDSHLTGMFYDISPEELQKRQAMFEEEAKMYGMFAAKKKPRR